jgi:hypothetical protein
MFSGAENADFSGSTAYTKKENPRNFFPHLLLLEVGLQMPESKAQNRTFGAASS